MKSDQEQGQDRLEEEIKSRDVMTNVKEEHFDEAHIVDLLSNEYSLEEIIYQLARILFSQSLSQGMDIKIKKAGSMIYFKHVLL